MWHHKGKGASLLFRKGILARAFLESGEISAKFLFFFQYFIDRVEIFYGYKAFGKIFSSEVSSESHCGVRPGCFKKNARR